MAEDSGFEPDSWDSKSQVQNQYTNPHESIIKLVADVGIEPNVEFLPSGYEPDEIDLFSNPQ